MSDKTTYINEEELTKELTLLNKSYRLRELLEKEDLTQEEKNTLDKLKAENINPNHPKTKFGEYALLLIKRILSMPKYSGYTWKDDFTSSALEKLLSYAVRNYNPDKISKVSGTNVKAFAYLTQIIQNSILQDINSKKAEAELFQEYVNEVKYNLMGNDTPSVSGSKQITTSAQVEREDDMQDLDTIRLSQITEEGLMLVSKNDKVESDYKNTSCYSLMFIDSRNPEKPIYGNTISDVIDIALKNSSLLNISLEVFYDNYSIGYQEYETIKELTKGVEGFVLCKYAPKKYTPSFPAKEKKVKEETNTSALSEWE